MLEIVTKMRSGQREGKRQGWPDPGEMVKDGLKWSKGREAVREEEATDMSETAGDGTAAEIDVWGVGRGHQREERQSEMLEMIREHQ